MMPPHVPPGGTDERTQAVARRLSGGGSEHARTVPREVAVLTPRGVGRAVRGPAGPGVLRQPHHVYTTEARRGAVLGGPRVARGGERRSRGAAPAQLPPVRDRVLR